MQKVEEEVQNVWKENEEEKEEEVSEEKRDVKSVSQQNIFFLPHRRQS